MDPPKKEKKFEKSGGSDFSSQKNGWVGKISGGEGVLKKRGVSLIFILTNPFQCYRSLSVCCVCGFCSFTPFLSVLLVSKDEPSLTASNQQMYDFYKWIFEKKDIVESKFLI